MMSRPPDPTESRSIAPTLRARVVGLLRFVARRSGVRRSGKPLATRRGVALILVLSALTLLTIMLTEFQAEAGADLSSSLQARDGLKAEYAAKSGVNLARLLLAAEKPIRTAASPLIMMVMGTTTSPQLPVWKFAGDVLGVFNDAAGQQAFSSMSGLSVAGGEHLGMEGASFELAIVDEDSKLNLNIPATGTDPAVKQLSDYLFTMFNGAQYDPLFLNQDPDGNFSDRLTVCAAIVDWTDWNTNLDNCDPTVETAQQTTAGEDSYYQQLKDPYSRKNAAFDSLEELHLVRGVSDDFWNTFIDPDPDDPEKRNVTVWGAQSTVNVNNANPQVLVGVVCKHADLSQPSMCTDFAQRAGFISALSLFKSISHGVPLFPKPQDFVKAITNAKSNPMFQMLMSMLPPDMQFSTVKLTSEAELLKEITTESKVFSIYATGRVGVGKRETTVHIHEVVDLGQATPLGTGANGPPPDQAQNNANQATAAIPQRPSAAGNVVYYRMD